MVKLLDKYIQMVCPIMQIQIIAGVNNWGDRVIPVTLPQPKVGGVYYICCVVRLTISEVIAGFYLQNLVIDFGRRSLNASGDQCYNGNRDANNSGGQNNPVYSYGAGLVICEFCEQFHDVFLCGGRFKFCSN